MVPVVDRVVVTAAVHQAASVEVRPVVTVAVRLGQVAVLRAGRVVVPGADLREPPTLRPVVCRPVVGRVVVGRVVVGMQRVLDAGRRLPGLRALERAAQTQAVRAVQAARAARARLVGASVGRMRTDLTYVVRDRRWPSQLMQLQVVRGQRLRPVAGAPGAAPTELRRLVASVEDRASARLMAAVRRAGREQVPVRVPVRQVRREQPRVGQVRVGSGRTRRGVLRCGSRLIRSTTCLLGRIRGTTSGLR